MAEERRAEVAGNHSAEPGGAVPEKPVRFGTGMRALMVWSGLLNAVAAVCFIPAFPNLRASLGLPADPHPYYLWLLSGMVLCVGCGYLRMGLTGRPDRTLLGVGAAGKAVFGGLMVLFAATGELPLAAARSGLPDLVLAAVFVGWLVRTATPKSRA
jgi:hypothetical protein